MFKLQPKTTFWAKVPVSIPGETKPAIVEMEFKHLGREGLKSYFENLEGKKDAEALAEIIMNWRGVDAEFNPENLAELLENYPSASLSVFQTFRAESMEAKAKN